MRIGTPLIWGRESALSAAARLVDAVDRRRASSRAVENARPGSGPVRTDPGPLAGAVHRPSGAEKVLLAAGELRCWLALPGAPDKEWVPVVVRMTDGRLAAELWQSAPGWPTDLQRAGELTLHGLTVADGHPFTLLGGRVTAMATGLRGFEARRLGAQTLVLGAHVDESTTWSCLALQTARLHEWLGRDDVLHGPEYGEELFSINAHVNRWERTEPARLERDGTEILFAQRMEPHGEDGPDFTIRTQTDLVVRPRAPLTISEFDREYVVPMLSLMTLASSGPDGVIYRRVSDRDRKEAATVIHSGEFRVEPRPWDHHRIGRRFLFAASDIDEPIALFGRWLDLWPDTHDAILTFADTFREDVYTRSRVLALGVALEAYWRSRLARPGRQEPNQLGKYKQVHQHTGVRTKVLAVNDDQLKGLVAARHLYAHLQQSNQRITEQQIDDAIVDNARRAALLFQAAMLRDLGYDAKTITAWAERHTSDWPVG